MFGLVAYPNAKWRRVERVHGHEAESSDCYRHGERPTNRCAGAIGRYLIGSSLNANC